MEYFVFADRRELVGGDAPLSGEVVGELADVRELLREAHWQYELTLVYRESGQTDWTSIKLLPSRRGRIKE